MTTNLKVMKSVRTSERDRLEKPICGWKTKEFGIFAARFKATMTKTAMEYSSILTRISREYDRRFRCALCDDHIDDRRFAAPVRFQAAL